MCDDRDGTPAVQHGSLGGRSTSGGDTDMRLALVRELSGIGSVELRADLPLGRVRVRLGRVEELCEDAVQRGAVCRRQAVGEQGRHEIEV
jgi:hypothetical protein